jgi:membrane-associated phospholipid phosphatase
VIMFATNFRQAPLQAHEYSWGGFLLTGCIEIGRTFAHGTTPAVAMVWPLLMAGLFAAMLAVRRSSGIARRLGWAYYPVAMNVAYFAMGPVVLAATNWRADSLLQTLDFHLVGENLSLRLEPYVSSPLCDAFSVGYLSFIVILVAFYGGYLVSGRNLERCFRGLFMLYGVGFTLYVLFPAGGPYVAMADQFQTALHGSALTTFNLHVASTGSNHVDVFPSLHVGISVFIWLTLLKDYRRVAWALLPLLLLLWSSTVFLRFHYATDVLCGALLAAFCFWFTAIESTSNSKIRNVLNGRAALQ